MSNERMTYNRTGGGTGHFGYQPTEKRGHQPVATNPKVAAGGGQGSGQAASGPPSIAPTQGSSARK